MYKRFLTLLATNDVSRIRQLVSVALNNGDGIQAIINKFTLAANDLYRPKGWDSNDVDLYSIDSLTRI